MSDTAPQNDWKALFNPFDEGLVAEPFGRYDQLRAQDPVHWSPPLRCWVLTRMEDVRAVLEDASFEVAEVAQAFDELTKRAGRDYRPIARVLEATLFFKDGEGHQKDRRTVTKIINRMGLSQLEPTIEAFAASLTAKLSDVREYDAVKSFAEPLPQFVMGHILGLSANDVTLLSDFLADVTLIFDLAPLAVFDRINGKVRLALELLETGISQAVANQETNGLSIIFDGASGTDAERLERAAGTALFAYLVGSETTAGLIGMLIRTLVQQPALREIARKDPSVIPGMVSDVLRLEANVQRAYRVARQQRVLGNKTIEPGDRLLLLLGAANRDPAAFAEPNRLKTDRDEIPGVSFGGGRHFCLGASLSQLEGRIALEHFLRLPPVALAGEEKWYAGRSIRRLREFPVRVDKASISSVGS